jgi:transcriptional regulator with PAS, ATPase and Fis domain
MKKILASWIGFTDIRASKASAEDGLGPIGQAVKAMEFDLICLISDFNRKEIECYIEWLGKLTEARIVSHKEKLSGPTHFGEIYLVTSKMLNGIRSRYGDDVLLTFHLSPGTPAMASVWIILAKTRFSAELIESSVHEGTKIVSLPFDIAAEFLPDLLKKQDSRLEFLAKGVSPDTPEFSGIIHRSLVMKRVILKARHIAARSIPILIEGETGTGKELLARAIHQASPRREKPFIPVNCGAIPRELQESEFFGYEKGAFTGATRQKHGYFESADGGTIFLDEIGELPGSAQVKMLRAIQEKEITRVGSVQPISFDARIIAATHKNLVHEIVEGRFREDLFYRIAVAVLKLPPIRERPGDLGVLIDYFLHRIHAESEEAMGHLRKKISASARNFMLQHEWPGNVRELQNTLMRAVIWSSEKTIGIEDVREAIIPMSHSDRDTLMNRSLRKGINLPDLVNKLSSHYLKRAIDEAHGNKTKAAQLLGLPSYQTLSNWMKKYNVD